jgi:hypothetical protein
LLQQSLKAGRAERAAFKRRQPYFDGIDYNPAMKVLKSSEIIAFGSEIGQKLLASRAASSESGTNDGAIFQERLLSNLRKFFEARRRTNESAQYPTFRFRAVSHVIAERVLQRQARGGE